MNSPPDKRSRKSALRNPAWDQFEARLMKPGLLRCLVLLLPLLLPSPSRAGWFDPHWLYRRVLSVNWDADNASGDDLATADFLTAGHIAPNAADVRVVAEDGRVLPSHILTIGPGDRVRLVFALRPHQSKYYAYF